MKSLFFALSLLLLYFSLVVTIYATLGDDALIYGFNEAEAKYVMVDAALLPKLKNLISQLKYVEQIVYFGSAKKALVQEFPEHIKVYSLQQIKDIGSKLKNSMNSLQFLLQNS